MKVLLATSTVPDRRQALLKAVKACLATGDQASLMRFVRRDGSVAELGPWVLDPDVDVAKAAALALGLLGGCAAALPLLGGLHHDDPMVVAAVESALWRLWMGAAGTGARKRTLEASAMIERGEYAAAIATLNGVLEAHPDFAEAYHQRGLSYLSTDEPARSIPSFRQALRFNSAHFGALTGLGHAFAHLGRPTEALGCYRAALNLHPRMDGVRQAIRKLRLRSIASNS